MIFSGKGCNIGQHVMLGLALCNAGLSARLCSVCTITELLSHGFWACGFWCVVCSAAHAPHRHSVSNPTELNLFSCRLLMHMSPPLVCLVLSACSVVSAEAEVAFKHPMHDQGQTTFCGLLLCMNLCQRFCRHQIGWLLEVFSPCGCSARVGPCTVDQSVGQFL